MICGTYRRELNVSILRMDPERSIVTAKLRKSESRSLKT